MNKALIVALLVGALTSTQAIRIMAEPEAKDPPTQTPGGPSPVDQSQ